MPQRRSSGATATLLMYAMPAGSSAHKAQQGARNCTRKVQNYTKNGGSPQSSCELLFATV
jgi:hypothetical protein